jgi:polygalacturonase
LAGVTPAAAKAGATSGRRFFEVKSLGAAGDGKASTPIAINRAIDACNAGGDVVSLAGGLFQSGTVVLKSNVTLYLEADGAGYRSAQVTLEASQMSGPQKPMELVAAPGPYPLSLDV